MNKIGIITDSGSDLIPELYDGTTVKVLPFQIIFPEKTYEDGVTISPGETYDRMLAGTIPTTSLPQGSDMVAAIEDYIKRGYDEIIAIFISNKLSGTSQAFANIASEFSDRIKITLVDSLTLTLAQGLQVLKAEKLVKAGQSVSQIIPALNEYRKNINVYFVLDTLEYLMKGGRMGKVSGALGQLLNIKPLIHVHEDGYYHTMAKVRGRKSATAKLIDILKTKHLSKGPCNVFPMHGGAPELLDNLREQLDKLPDVTIPYSGEITPSLGIHTGPGLYGFIVENQGTRE